MKTCLSYLSESFPDFSGLSAQQLGTLHSEKKKLMLTVTQPISFWPLSYTPQLFITHTLVPDVRFFFLSQSCNQKQSSTITSHLPPLSPSLYPLLLLFSLPLGCLTHSLSSTLNWITSPSTRSTDSFLYTPALSGCSAGVFEILARCGGTAQGLLPSIYKGKPPDPLDCIPVCCQVPKWKWLKLPCEAAAFRHQVSSRVVPGQIQNTKLLRHCCGENVDGTVTKFRAK